MKDYSYVRGFNYQPSYGSTSLENWVNFNADIFELEMRRGKEYFPKFNTVRYWLSWDAYYRKPDEFKRNFEKALDIADRLGIKVVVCLLNRWHDTRGIDNGGVSLDNILFPGCWSYYREYYKEYVSDIVSAHINDSRILIWDICNEPFSYKVDYLEEMKPYIQPEIDWLTQLYNTIKDIDPNAQVGTSIHPAHGKIGIEQINHISDVFLVHPYHFCTPENVHDLKHLENHIEKVEMYCNYAKEQNKPILVTETCWGATTDEVRAEIIKVTLDVLVKHNVGFLAHALHYSKVADLHFGDGERTGKLCNFAFTTEDGLIRPYHEVFNNY